MMTRLEYQRAQRTITFLNTLNKYLGWIASTLIIGATLFYLFVAFFGVINALQDKLTETEALLLVMCVLTFILGLFVAGLSYLCGAGARQLVAYSHKHYRPAKIPLDPMEKDQDFNRDVLRFFHSGPELRDPDDPEFRAGFKDRR